MIDLAPAGQEVKDSTRAGLPEAIVRSEDHIADRLRQLWHYQVTIPGSIAEVAGGHWRNAQPNMIARSPTAAT